MTSDIQFASHCQSVATGRAKWRGIVVIDRPDPASQREDEEKTVLVYSMRTQDGAMRAVVCRVPWAAVSHYYTVDDTRFVPVYAELIGGHLQLLDRAKPKDAFVVPEEIIYQ